MINLLVRNVFLNKDIELEDLGNGVSRKILAYNDNIMAVEVFFEEGAIGSIHSHPHEQITYILEGEFEFTIDGKKSMEEVFENIIEHILEDNIIAKGKEKNTRE